MKLFRNSRPRRSFDGRQMGDSGRATCRRMIFSRAFDMLRRRRRDGSDSVVGEKHLNDESSKSNGYVRGRLANDTLPLGRGEITCRIRITKEIDVGQLGCRGPHAVGGRRRAESSKIKVADSLHAVAEHAQHCALMMPSKNRITRLVSTTRTRLWLKGR